LNILNRLRLIDMIHRALRTMKNEAEAYGFKEDGEYHEFARLVGEHLFRLQDRNKKADYEILILHVQENEDDYQLKALTRDDICWNLHGGELIRLETKASSGEWKMESQIEVFNHVHTFMDMDDVIFQSGRELDLDKCNEEWRAYQILEKPVYAPKKCNRRWPYNTGPGWWSLIDSCMARIRQIDPYCKLVDVKEKYGVLCAHVRTKAVDKQAIYDIEHEMELWSESVCEFCGADGKLVEQDDWLFTLCDRCAALNPIERREIEQKTADRYFAAEDLKMALGAPYLELHAVYEPDGSQIFGDCYCAAVDLFQRGMTFRVWFKYEDSKVNIVDVSRWCFG